MNANEVCRKVIFLHLFVILFTGGVPGQVHPPGTRYTPWTRYTPLDQVHSLDQVQPPDKKHPPGTRYTPPDKVHPLASYTPPPPKTRHNLPDQAHTPRHQVHPPAREIRATSGRYVSFWNAFLLSICLQLVWLFTHKLDCKVQFAKVRFISVVRIYILKFN